MLPPKEDLELKLAAIKHEAEHKSSYETSQFIGLARFCHHMACQNTENQLRPSDTGGLIIPPTMLSQMALGFAQDAHGKPVFCVFFQPYLWEMVKYLPLEGMVLEKDQQSVLLRFKEVVVGEFKIPAMDLSLPVISRAIWEKLISGDIKICTLGGVERAGVGSDKFYCAETQTDPRPFLQDFYVGRQRNALF